MVVGEQALRHRDREPRRLGQQCEANLELHLRAPAVAACVVEIAGELDEEVGRKLGAVVFDGQQCLAAGAAPAKLPKFGDGADSGVGLQRTGGPERVGEEARTAVTQRAYVGGHVDAEVIAPHPAVTRHGS